MCGKGRELLEVVRLDPSRRRHSIAWQGHHYEHYDIIANDVWRYAQVD
jgi:phage-related protein